MKRDRDGNIMMPSSITNSFCGSTEYYPDGSVVEHRGFVLTADDKRFFHVARALIGDSEKVEEAGNKRIGRTLNNLIVEQARLLEEVFPAWGKFSSVSFMPYYYSWPPFELGNKLPDKYEEWKNKNPERFEFWNKVRESLQIAKKPFNKTTMLIWDHPRNKECCRYDFKTGYENIIYTVFYRGIEDNDHLHEIRLAKVGSEALEAYLKTLPISYEGRPDTNQDEFPIRLDVDIFKRNLSVPPDHY